MHTSPQHGYPADLVQALLARTMARHRPGASPRVLGISGLQGSGKSTLAAQLVAAAGARGLNAASLSIDDVYLTRAERQRLAREVHPLLATRGPPGTHDVALALTLFDALAAGGPARLPRFDKLGDDRLPAAHWQQVPAGLDLLVFEGWCIGTPAQEVATLATPLNALERDEDPDGRWRHWCNAALARDYPALWRRIDHLVFLQPPDFETVHAWRWQQEQALQALEPRRTSMDRKQLARFIQHYERISRQAIACLPERADSVVRLDAARRVCEVRLGGDTAGSTGTTRGDHAIEPDTGS